MNKKLRISAIVLSVLCVSLLWTVGAFCQTEADEEQGIEGPGDTQGHFAANPLIVQTMMRGSGLLLVTNSSTDTVGVFHPDDGTYLGDLITQNPGFSTPINAVLGPDGNIYVSDQVADSVFVFDQVGNYLYAYADGSDGLNNIRGIDFRNGHLFVTSGDNYVAEFDGPHSRLPDFIPTTENVDSFDILFLADGTCLVADIEGSLDNIRYYDANGVFQYELFKINFPEQVSFDSVPPSEFLVAGFSANILEEFDLAGNIYNSVAFSGGRGVYRLGNGNYLATKSDGVWEVDPETGTLLQQELAGSSHFIEHAAMSLLATADIKVNGLDAGVVVPDGGNAAITIDVKANDEAGTLVDVWVLVKSLTTGKKWSYNLAAARWFKGWCYEYYTGPLTDSSDTVLDMPLPVGEYIAHLAADTIPNGNINATSLLTYDSVDFSVITVSGFTEDFDDGIADNWTDDGAHWSVTGGVYFLDCPSYAEFFSFYNFPAYSDFTYSVDVLQVDTGDYTTTYDYGMRFRHDGVGDNYYELYAQSNGYIYLYKRVSGSTTLLKSGTPASYVSGVGVWNNLKVDVNGSAIDVYVNGVLEADLSTIDTAHTVGYVGLFGEGSGSYNQDYQFDNVILSL